MTFFSTNKQLLVKAKKHVSLLDAEVLLCFFLKKERSFLRSYPEFVPSLLVQWNFWRAVKKKERGIPVAYITGEKAFFGLDFFVNKHTLVPRPDTEVMVECVLQHFNKNALQQAILLDVGTGSGCIPISVLQNIPTLQQKSISCFATDVSKKALKIAKKNAVRHDVTIRFLHGNLLAPVQQYLSSDDEIIITANLPYLTEAQWQAEASIKREPKSALVANDGGLALYEELFTQLISLSLTRVCCFMEIDPTQTQRLSDMVFHYFPQATVRVIQDYAGKDRIVHMVLRP